MHSLFQENILLSVVLLLALSVLTVSVARRLHFPPILSYILVGILVGPGGFSLIQDETNIRFLAEFGIVFLLFTIGLEFSIAQMRAMRNIVFGLGTLQVLVTGGLAFLIGWLMGFDQNTNIVIASVVIMSSTAIAIKQLSEQGEIQSRHARNAIGVSIFQDIASIPLLILFTALAFTQSDISLGEALGISFLKGVFVVILMLLLGRYLLRPLFHEVAAAKSTELFMLTVLLVALGAATFTEQIGLSLTLGAFLAGMMLGETQFRHQIESDIRPFQDILLGLFFITVGMMIMPMLIWQNLGIILLATFAIILLKALVVYGLMRLFFRNMGSGVAIRTAVTLAQVGEFGLVLIALGFSYQLLAEQIGQLLLSAAVLSMMIAPFLVRFNGRIASALSFDYVQEKRTMETHIEQDNEYLKDHVIVCGFGRVGQITSRFLRNANQPYIALDLDATRLKEAQLAGENVYFGDAAKPDILRAAKIEKAKIIIITHHDFHLALKTLRSVRSIDAKIPVLVRTPDDAHVDDLLAAGATEVIPDYFESSIMLASHLLLMLGHAPSQVLRETRKARADRYSLLSNFYPGESDLRTGSPMVQGGVIHAVKLDDAAYAIGKRLHELPFEKYQIHVDAVKRGSVRGENPDDYTRLRADDTLVISGLPEAVEAMDRILKNGE
jgi:CPA2 family monovalent cation:H+ antiporter-2